MRVISFFPCMLFGLCIPFALQFSNIDGVVRFLHPKNAPNREFYKHATLPFNALEIKTAQMRAPLSLSLGYMLILVMLQSRKFLNLKLSIVCRLCVYFLKLVLSCVPAAAAAAETWKLTMVRDFDCPSLCVFELTSYACSLFNEFIL